MNTIKITDEAVLTNELSFDTNVEKVILDELSFMYVKPVMEAFQQHPNFNQLTFELVNLTALSVHALKTYFTPEFSGEIIITKFSYAALETIIMYLHTLYTQQKNATSSYSLDKIIDQDAKMYLEHYANDDFKYELQGRRPSGERYEYEVTPDDEFKKPIVHALSFFQYWALLAPRSHVEQEFKPGIDSTATREAVLGQRNRNLQ